MSDSESGGMGEGNSNVSQGLSTQEAITSISEGIGHLESFLDELTQTLMVQNQQVEAMNRERQEYLTRITPPVITPTAITNRSQLSRPLTGRQRNNPEHYTLLARHAPPINSLRPSRFQMGREMAPPIRQIPAPPISRPMPVAPPPSSQINDDPGHLILERMRSLSHIQPGFFGPDVRLDIGTQFGPFPTTSNPTPNNGGVASDGGGDMLVMGQGGRIPFQNAPLLVQVVKRAADAAAAAGDSSGHAQLAQFQNQLVTTLRREVGIMQNVAENNTPPMTGAVSPTPPRLDSSSSSESESGGESSDFELHDWDRGTVRTLLNDYFRTDPDESEDSDEEGRLIFFGIFNNGDNNGGGVGMAGGGTEGRRPVNRNLSPDTVKFYESIGIRIDEEDVAKMVNGYNNAVVMPCPQTLYPEGEPMGPETPTPFIYFGNEDGDQSPRLTLNSSVFELLGDDENDLDDIGQGHVTVEPTDNVTPQDVHESGHSPMEWDAEDLELEKLIIDFKRKKLEGKTKMEKETPGPCPVPSTSKSGSTECQVGSSVAKVGKTGCPVEGQKEKKVPPKSAPGGRQGHGPVPTGGQKPTEEVKVRHVQMTTCLTTTSTIKKKGTNKKEK